MRNPQSVKRFASLHVGKHDLPEMRLQPGAGGVITGNTPPEPAEQWKVAGHPALPSSEGALDPTEDSVQHSLLRAAGSPLWDMPSVATPSEDSTGFGNSDLSSGPGAPRVPANSPEPALSTPILEAKSSPVKAEDGVYFSVSHSQLIAGPPGMLSECRFPGATGQSLGLRHRPGVGIFHRDPERIPHLRDHQSLRPLRSQHPLTW